MGKRELTALVLMPVVLAAIRFLPPYVYLIMLWLVGMGAAFELVKIMRILDHPVPVGPSLAVLGLGLPAVWLLGVGRGGWVLAAILVLVPAVHLLGRFPVEGAAVAISGASFVSAYFLVTCGAMGFLRTAFPETMGWKVVFLHCLTVWGADSGAYYLGSRFGRHRMAPIVSPKKSWEGFVGGAITTVIGVAFCRVVFLPELSVPVAAGLAAVLIVAVPVGDLVESLFKRDAKVKDSGSSIPGHGGFLDRSDSIFFAAPFTLALLLLAGLGR